MSRYRNELGIMGNIKLLFANTTKTNNNFINHKSAYDVDHISMEQALTELDIQNIEAEQFNTDLDLRVMELEAK